MKETRRARARREVDEALALVRDLDARTGYQFVVRPDALPLGPAVFVGAPRAGALHDLMTRLGRVRVPSEVVTLAEDAVRALEHNGTFTWSERRACEGIVNACLSLLAR